MDDADEFLAWLDEDDDVADVKPAEGAGTGKTEADLLDSVDALLGGAPVTATAAAEESDGEKEAEEDAALAPSAPGGRRGTLEEFASFLDSDDEDTGKSPAAAPAPAPAAAPVLPPLAANGDVVELGEQAGAPAPARSATPEPEAPPASAVAPPALALHLRLQRFALDAPDSILPTLGAAVQSRNCPDDAVRALTVASVLAHGPLPAPMRLAIYERLLVSAPPTCPSYLALPPQASRVCAPARSCAASPWLRCTTTRRC